MKMDEVKKLAQEHWNYVEELLHTHGESDDVIEKIGFHYKSAMIHGVKHGAINPHRFIGKS